MKPSPQVVKVHQATETEVSTLVPKVKISWKTIFAAGITVEDFPDIEAPLVVDVIDAFLIRMSHAAPKIAKGGLITEHGMGIEQINSLIKFIQEDRIEVDGLVLRSPT